MLTPQEIKDLRERIKQVEYNLPPSAKGGGAVSVPLSQLDDLLDAAEYNSQLWDENIGLRIETGRANLNNYWLGKMCQVLADENSELTDQRDEAFGVICDLNGNGAALQQDLAASQDDLNDSRADNDRLLLRIKELDSEVKAGAHLVAKYCDAARQAEIDTFGLRQSVEALKSNAKLFEAAKDAELESTTSLNEAYLKTLKKRDIEITYLYYQINLMTDGGAE
jgi:septal ring factor EnvC (AmiA/AmiB activator)